MPCKQRGVRTAVPQDVNFSGDPVSPWPRHPDLHEGMSEIFRDRDVDPALAGQVQRGSGVGILPVEHLLGEVALSLCVHHDSLRATCKRPAACCRTLYPVTADSSVCATTGSHLMLTVDPEKVQEMLPGGLLGAKRHKRRQIQQGGGEEELVLPAGTSWDSDRAAGNTLVGVMGSTPAKRTMFLQKRRKNTVYIYFGATGNK